MSVQERFKKAIVMLVLGAAVSTALGAAYTPESYDPRRSINGVLTEYRAGIMKVETEGGEAWEFNVLPDAGIAIDGAKAEQESLKPGMVVAVTPSREEPSKASSVVASNPVKPKSE